MPAPITTVVDVSVVVAGASAEKFSFGALMGVFDHSVTANRQDGPYFSLAEVVAAGFTAAAEPEVNAWATAAFSQDLGVSEVIIGREDVGDATWTVTMDAIEAAGSETWYITTIESRVDADIAAVAAWTEARDKIFIAQSSDLAGLVAFTSLNTFGYLRTAGIYHLTSTGTDGYLDGAWASRGGGLNLDAPKGRGTWFAKELSGVTFDVITGAEATSILAIGANFFGRNLGLSFTQSGTVAKSSTDFIDITTTKDWVKKRIDERVVEGFVGTPTVVPYTNAGINVAAGWLQEILDRGVTFGHFTNDSANGPGKVLVPDVSTISEAVKKTRVLTLTAEATFAGGIQKLIITVNISF